MSGPRALLAIALAGALVLPAAGIGAKPPDGASAGAADSLHLFLQTHFADAREAAPTTRFAAANADLDGDGSDEAIVYIFDGDERYWCGTGGCNLFVFTRRDEAWRLVTEMSVANPPIRLLDSRSHGWRDLGVFAAGGGIPRGYEARMRFDGAAYPDNPTADPAEMLTEPAAGTELIGRDPEGRPLF